MSNKCPNCGGPTIPGFHYKNYCKNECDLKAKPAVTVTDNSWSISPNSGYMYRIKYTTPPPLVFKKAHSIAITIPTSSFVPGAIKYATGISLGHQVGWKFQYTTNNLYDTAAQSDAAFPRMTHGFGTGEVKLLATRGKSGTLDIWEVELIRYP